MFRAIVPLCVLLAACATPLAPPSLAGTWKVIAINGEPTMREGRLSLVIPSDAGGPIHGSVACNAYAGALTRGERTIQVTEMDQTLLGCRDARVDMRRHFQESNAFSQVLSSGEMSVDLTQRQLILTAHDGQQLQFERH